jgi:2-methylisocitrate lyase-like PEP mutase family enzyme
MTMADAETLRTRLTRKPVVVAPGIYDALTAHLAERAGFSTLYVSGAAIAYTRLGRPDIGLVAMNEVVDAISMISDRVRADLVVDADTGYGNALNVGRTMRLFERAGARAIQLEDQAFPKRCGHLDNKTLIPPEEMIGKIKAALDARRSRETLVIARTDAVAVEGFDHAVARAISYRDAGADILFIEAPKTRAELQRIPPAVSDVPLMANMVEGGKTPPLNANELEAIGFSLVIFPGAIVRVLARAADEFYAVLAAKGTSEPFQNRMYDFTALNELIGTPEMIALGKQYEANTKKGGNK